MIKILATGSSGNSYIIQANDETLLIECGIKYNALKKGINYKLDNVVGCLVTHKHKDHSESASGLANDGVCIYGPSELIEELKPITNKYRLKTVSSKESFSIGNFKIKTFECFHSNGDGSPCECIGYLINHRAIGTILFATDTYLIKPIFKNIDYILVECNFDDEEEIENHDLRRLKSHMSLNSLKRLIARWDLNRTKSITLIHLSDLRADSGRMQREIEEVTKVPVIIGGKGVIIQ